jgi:hypothetical protein
MSVPFADYGVRWFTDIINRLTSWFTSSIRNGYEALTEGLLETPLPSGSGVELVFSKPAASDEPWHSMYEATVGGEMMLFGLLILFLCVQARHFIRIFDFGSAHEHRRTRRSAVTGAFLIISWYWVAVLTLYLVQALTLGFIPDIGWIVSVLLDILPQSLDTPLLTLSMAGVGWLSITLLRMLFVIRELLLYVFVYVMPVGIAVVYGNIPIVSEIAKRFCVQFIALAVLPLPVALLLRGYSLLFAGGTQIPIEGSFVGYIAVISLPLLGAYVTWKTFTYAAPLASRTISAVGRGGMYLGAVGAAASTVGPRAAVVASRMGSKGAAGMALAGRYNQDTGDAPQVSHSQVHVRHIEHEQPTYRRTENDPKR